MEQLVATAAGLMLLTAVLQVWRRSIGSSIRWLAVQGAALALLVAGIGASVGEAELVAVAALVLALKAGAIPWVLARAAATTGQKMTGGPDRAEPGTRRPPGGRTARVNPTSALLAVAGLTALAYLVGRPLTGAASAVAGGAHGPALRAVPVGLALVLIGFLVLLTRRTALEQLVGFVVLDNGVALVAFLVAGGVPLVVELGVSLDVLLVVLILRVLTSRMHLVYGGLDLDDLKELRD